MNDYEPTDERLVRLLGATRANADPAMMARVRARIHAAVDLPRPLAWLGTPAAVACACALFVAVAGVSLALVRADSSTTRDTTLVSALIGDDGSYGLPGTGAASAERSASGASDTGGVTR
jgi:hypothetical protein